MFAKPIRFQSFLNKSLIIRNQTIMKKTILLFAVFTYISIAIQAQTVTDIDGNTYNTVTIGTHVWMKENLKVTHYQNGDSITLVVPTNLWNLAATPARCYYNNDSIANKNVYGGLYNGHVVNDSRNVCPYGWHVPSDTEWNIMGESLGSDTLSIGGFMKEAGFTHWITPNTGASNSSDFTALPGGQRSYDGMFNNLTNIGYFWTSTTGTNSSLIARYLSYNNENLLTDEFNASSGFSVRCIIDTITTQIDDIGYNKQIQIYPNPATDRVFVNITQGLDLKMQIFNIIGECVFQSHLQGGMNDIPVSSLKSGVYVIRIYGTNEVFQQKLVKE